MRMHGGKNILLNWSAFLSLEIAYNHYSCHGLSQTASQIVILPPIEIKIGPLALC
jgi:hypothetical protein